MTTNPSPTASSLEPTEQAWLTLREAADILGVHANTLRRWTDRASIHSYRTIGGHRRLAAGDVYAMAQRDVASPEADTAYLDEHTSAVVESTLRGDLSENEGRLRLRTLGHSAGAAARHAGQTAAETISSHLAIRRAIGDVVKNVRFAAGIGRSEVDERDWSNSLADAFILGLAESAGPVPVRVRGGDSRGGAAAVGGRRGPPQ